MQRRKRMKLTRTFVGVLAIAGLVLSAGAGAKDLRLGLITPPSHAWSQAALAMGAELKEKTGGKYSVTIFPSGQLGNEAQMLQQLQTGALDMAFLTLAEITNRIPDFGAFYAPYLVDNVEQAGKLLNGPTAQKMLGRLPREAGVVGVGYGIAAMRTILTAFPVDDVGDLNGRKLRITPFGPVKDFYQLLGVAPTPMPLPDVYDGLANGQVDGVDGDVEVIWKLNLYSRGKMMLHSDHMMFPLIGLVSARVWQQLPKDDRALIAELSRKHLDALFDEYSAVSKDMLQKLQASNLQVVPVGPAFFGDKIDQWEKLWSRKAPVLEQLRKEAQAIK
jgi:TRAP-type C4-dicarboxylate transport system substrate-binding protein